jgi:tetratricopeptide (TPR) repeat protein
MSSRFATSFQRLIDAPASRQARLARALTEEGTQWSAWIEQFNRVHGQRPETEVRAARALCGAYGAAGDRAMAARFRLLEARAIHRAGSPSEAAAAFGRAARELAAAGDGGRAAQANVLRVDALATAGRVQEALSLGRTTARRLRGAAAPAWRGALRVNVANALRLHGDLDGAVRAYDAAAGALARHGNAQNAAIARMNGGVALLDAGQAEGALARFDEAARSFAAAGDADMELEARYNRASALVRAARLGEAVRTLVVLADEHAARGLVRREALCRMDLADALARAGDVASARVEAERAAEAFARDGAAAERAEALRLSAATSATLAETLRALRRAAVAATASGRPGVALRCALDAEDARLRGGTRPSEATVARIAARAVTLRQDEIAALARLLLGDAELSRGRVGFARHHFDVAGRASPGRPWIRAAVEAGRASCLAREGQSGRAIERLRRVAEFLDSVRAGLPGSWLRTTFVLRRLDPYLARVELLLDRGSPADRREAEALLDALASRRYLERARPSASRGSLERLRRRLEAIYDRIRRGPSSTRGTANAGLATEEALATALERRAADAWRAAERTARATPGLETSRPAPSWLSAREAALHAWVRGGRVRTLLRRGPDVIDVSDAGAVRDIEQSLERLEFHAERQRLFGPSAADAPFRAGLDSLAARLLVSVARAPSIDALHLVLDPDVPDVPWELLPLGGRPLCAALRALRVPCLRVRRPRATLCGDLTWVSAGESSLPSVASEASRLPEGALVLSGPSATRESLAAALGRPGAVHVSAHGVSAPDAPHLGGVRIHSGWFSAADVPAVVRADLVALAACRSGEERGTAAAAWGGLPCALLAAGARRVLWSSSEVDDDVAAELGVRFHALLRTGSAEASFGRAVESLSTDSRAAACLLPFRLSGVLP